MIQLALNTFNYKEYDTVSVEGKRVYKISDEKYYPSITTVLGGTQEVDKKSSLEAWKARVGNKEAKRIGDAAASRGTNTHLMLERYLRNEDPKLETFPPEHIKMFNSLRLQLKNINIVYGQEVVLYSDILGVAGRCDLVAEYNGEMTIVDYKTSTRVKSINEIGDYWLQLSFYLTAHNELYNTNIEKMVILMAVENKLPMVFKKSIDDELLLKLAERTTEFYEKL